MKTDILTIVTKHIVSWETTSEEELHNYVYRERIVKPALFWGKPTIIEEGFFDKRNYMFYSIKFLHEHDFIIIDKKLYDKATLTIYTNDGKKITKNFNSNQEMENLTLQLENIIIQNKEVIFKL